MSLILAMLYCWKFFPASADVTRGVTKCPNDKEATRKGVLQQAYIMEITSRSLQNRRNSKAQNARNSCERATKSDGYHSPFHCIDAEKKPSFVHVPLIVHLDPRGSRLSILLHDCKKGH